MRRRSRPEALKSVGHPMRLAVHDMLGNLLEERELAPWTNLRAVLNEEMEFRSEQGWTTEEPPSDSFGGFFCHRDGARVLVSVCAETLTAHSLTSSVRGDDVAAVSRQECAAICNRSRSEVFGVAHDL